VIEFPPLAKTDLPLVEEWLRREHVARWWRDDIRESVAEYRGALEGREPTDHFLIEVDGRPVGMIQTYLVSDYPEWEEVVQVGAGVAGVDLMIGEADLIGVGLGPRVLAQFARDVVFTRAGVDAVVATVEEPNCRSWRAFEKAGFRHVRGVEEDGLPHRLMRLDRPG
jgi:aminoglycoside 6'-N-acetyltransferase